MDQVVLPRISQVYGIHWNPSATLLLLAGAPEGRSEGLWVLPRGSGAPRQLMSSYPRSFGFLDDQRIFLSGLGGLRICSTPDRERQSIRCPSSMSAPAKWLTGLPTGPAWCESFPKLARGRIS